MTSDRELFAFIFIHVEITESFNYNFACSIILHAHSSDVSDNLLSLYDANIKLGTTITCNHY